MTFLQFHCQFIVLDHACVTLEKYFVLKLVIEKLQPLFSCMKMESKFIFEAEGVVHIILQS